MYEQAVNTGLALIGLSEHSPRPAGFDYTREYRDRLTRLYPEYIREVRSIQASPDPRCRLLLGLEMDWLAGQEDFTASAVSEYDYDYIIGSVHFLDHWGFDDAPWADASQEICESRYRRYFELWADMLRSGLFQIAAHPDLIKIYSVNQFHSWLARPESQELVRDCLLILRDQGMALEISSAGLRKACREIYPCEEIMRMASGLNLMVSMASDAHCCADVGADFDRLAAYAHAFGFTRQAIFEHGGVRLLPF